MRFPRSISQLWTLAGVLVVIIAAGAVYAITASGTPAKKVASVPTTTPTATTTTSTVTTPITTTTPAAPSKHVNNFTVAYYGNQRTRTRDFAEASDLNPPFKLAWSFGGNALLEFPATIWGNNLYLIDDGATVKRVNITTGRQIWLRHVGLLSASTPSLDVKHKELFVSVLSNACGTIGCTDGEEAALSMRSGKILWTFPVSSGTESSPMIVGNSVYFGDQAGTLYSLNIRTGHENWSFPTDGSIKGAPAYWGGNLYFGTYGGSFYAVGANSGREVWSASPGGQFYSTPAIGFGHVYVGNKNGDAYAFDLRNGALAWSAGLGGYVYGGPAVAEIPGLGPTVYIGSYNRRPVCAERRNRRRQMVRRRGRRDLRIGHRRGQHRLRLDRLLQGQPRLRRSHRPGRLLLPGRLLHDRHRGQARGVPDGQVRPLQARPARREVAEAEEEVGRGSRCERLQVSCARA